MLFFFLTIMNGDWEYKNDCDKFMKKKSIQNRE